MRGTWVWDKQKMDMVPANEYYARQQQGVKRSDLPSPQLMRDIEPFRNVAVDGAEITSRSHKREMMKRHNLTEVGNDYKAMKRKPSKPTRSEVRASMKKSIQQLGGL